jgi:hypothetical protein
VILNTPPRMDRPHGLVPALCCAGLLLCGTAIARGQQPAEVQSSTSSAKPKKVWTNEDLAPAQETTAAPAKAPGSPAPAGKDLNAQLAAQLRARLETLQRQSKDADTQLEELKRFEAGEGSGEAGRQLHKRYSTAPIPEQIAKLELKRKQLQEKIEAIYEEARKKGLLPGQLR